MSLPTGLILPYPAGGDQWPIHEPMPADATSFVMNTVTQNAALIVRFRLAKSMVVASLACGIGSANGNIDQGLWLPNAAFDSFTLLAKTGSVAAAGANAKQSAALSAAVALSAGIDYCYIFATDSATLTIYRISQALTGLNSYNFKVLVKAAQWSGGLPATPIVTPSAGQYRPWFALEP